MLLNNNTGLSYGIRIEIANMGPKSSFPWNGKPYYEFDTIDEVCGFLSRTQLERSSKWLDRLREEDRLKGYGRLACNSWYEVIKGGTEPTDYQMF